MNDTIDPMSRLVRKTPITLVVATTPITRVVSSSSKESQTLLGIGLNGILPWPRIKADMSFFARVTSRRPGLSSSSTTSTTSTQASSTNNDDSQKEENNDSKNKNKTKNLNAIIMGRKTYYSLPKWLRPLKDRLSVIISRDAQGLVAAEVASDLARQLEKDRASNVRDDGEHAAAAAAAANVVRDAVVAHSLEEALNRLLNEGQQGQGPEQEQEQEEEEEDARQVFVIGGGEIYDSSLRMELPSIVHRILMTRVKRRDGREFDCDTFFPLTDDELSSSSSSSSSSQGNRGWRQVEKEELEDWVGEKIEDDWSDQGEVAIKIEGYERLLPLPTPCT